ncbi:hypothetical protein PUN28_000802 [Cardiocondyla obscurior]|uniref:Uncharacterized protein n=1 Tax=Cardiocondyla obscurior TaxID=286306 RepID=A0AAW2H151_9HYME
MSLAKILKKKKKKKSLVSRFSAECNFLSFKTNEIMKGKKYNLFYAYRIISTVIARYIALPLQMFSTDLVMLFYCKKARIKKEMQFLRKDQSIIARLILI